MLDWSYDPFIEESNMKRILASILVLSALSVGLVGCSDKKATPKKDSPAAAPAGEKEKGETPAAPAK